MRSIRIFLSVTILVVSVSTVLAGELAFREQELATRLTVGYAVRVLDMNEDRRPDIVIVDSKRILWLENPNWNEHVLTADPEKKFDNVCIAPSDIDGDGRWDFAVGADWQFTNTKSGGSVGWISGGEKPTAPWKYYSLGNEPTTHRMQFADLDGDGRDELINVPLKGRNTTDPNFMENGIRILAYTVPKNPIKDEWPVRVISDKLHVAHNFWPTDFDGDGNIDILVASFEGVTLLERQSDGTWNHTQLGTGNQESQPSRGASEIKNGRLANGQQYIATIEPWHGFQVVVYTHPGTERPKNQPWLWQRHVLDDDLKWGHAVYCANLDDDPDEELIIGVRDDKNDQARRGLRIYDPDSSGRNWQRTIVDPGSVAIEDLNVGDFNGDGRTDIVAVGRQTHNVKIYWNETK